MTAEVPARARQIAARLSALFQRDVEIVERLNDAQRRLRGANDRLWAGLHPDALGLVYDGAGRGGPGGSAITQRMAVAVEAGGGRRRVETVVLEALQEAHWQIHRGFCEYQSASEQRRQLAVDVGELSQQLVDELTASGWSAQAAREADVHELAGALR
jgi:hypothetical protein